MNTTTKLTKKKQGEQFIQAEKNIVITKMLDLLLEGYTSTNGLSVKIGVSRDTIERYRPLVDEIIGRTKLDRNVIRNLQVRRTYQLIEGLMQDLKECQTVKEKSMIYGNIFKFSSHLALICGLNVETQVNVDSKQLVIIRSAAKKKDNYIEVNSETDLPQVSA